MNVDLSGKVALVTGGARGIGRAISLALARLGAAVVVNYNRSEADAESLKSELDKAGLRVRIVRADITDAEQLDAMFDIIKREYGRLDILVNNAGAIKDGLLLTMRPRDWDRVHNVGLRAAFLCSQKAAEMMMLLHAGKIINISSVGAIRGGRGQTNYAAAKGGLLAFTRACAVELGPKNIQVNAALPGMIETRMSKRVRRSAGEDILARIPAGRFGAPEDIAALVAFLASPAADYITGQAICVDGGMSST